MLRSGTAFHLKADSGEERIDYCSVQARLCCGGRGPGSEGNSRHQNSEPKPLPFPLEYSVSDQLSVVAMADHAVQVGRVPVILPVGHSVQTAEFTWSARLTATQILTSHTASRPQTTAFEMPARLCLNRLHICTIQRIPSTTLSWLHSDCAHQLEKGA